MQSQPKKISEDNLKLLYSLFISNTPQSLKDDWKSNFVRIFSDLEYAHWFYLDNCLQDKNEVGLDLFGLCQEIFNRFPNLLRKKVDWKEKFSEWKRYRGTTCTGSAIVLDEYLSMVLLVKGFGNNRWTFPGGKISQGETLQDCAIREVMEETGLDIEHRVDSNLYLEVIVGETTHRAYVVEGFPRTSRLQPSTQNEIEAITWFSLASLPSNLQDSDSVVKMNFKPCHFYCVIPFVQPLRDYVKLRQQGIDPITALRQSTQIRNRLAPSTSCNQIYATTAPLVAPQPTSAFSLSRTKSTDRALFHPATSANRPPSKSSTSLVRSPPTMNNETRILNVEPTREKNSIWGGQVTINAKALVDILAPLPQPMHSLPTLKIFDDVNECRPFSPLSTI